MLPEFHAVINPEHCPLYSFPAVLSSNISLSRTAIDKLFLDYIVMIVLS